MEITDRKFILSLRNELDRQAMFFSSRDATLASWYTATGAEFTKALLTRRTLRLELIVVPDCTKPLNIKPCE